jgi:hypothetical protein
VVGAFSAAFWLLSGGFTGRQIISRVGFLVFCRFSQAPSNNGMAALFGTGADECGRVLVGVFVLIVTEYNLPELMLQSRRQLATLRAATGRVLLLGGGAAWRLCLFCWRYWSSFGDENVSARETDLQSRFYRLCCSTSLSSLYILSGADSRAFCCYCEAASMAPLLLLLASLSGTIICFESVNHILLSFQHSPPSQMGKVRIRQCAANAHIQYHLLFLANNVLRLVVGKSCNVATDCGTGAFCGSTKTCLCLYSFISSSGFCIQSESVRFVEIASVCLAASMADNGRVLNVTQYTLAAVLQQSSTIHV